MPIKNPPRLSPAEIAAALKRESLVGVMVASEMLGIKPSNFRRDAAPHLTAIPVDGSANVYFRSEVKALAKERSAARAARNGHG